MSYQPSSKTILIDGGRYYVENYIFQLERVRHQTMSVHPQEYDDGKQGRTLVSIHEGVIACYAEAVCRGEQVDFSLRLVIELIFGPGQG